MENETFRAIVLRQLEQFAEEHAQFDPNLKSTRQDWVSIFLGSEKRMKERRSKTNSRLAERNFNV